MLKQLSQLTLQADGRYACAEELEFLRDYIASSKSRMKTYQKLREVRGDIAIETALNLLEEDENLFIVEGEDYKPLFHRDQEISLRYTTATVLSGDLERLKQTLLLWYRTILNAAKPGKVKKWTNLTYKVKPKIILDKLDEEERQYVKPVLALNQTILGSL
ncbi:MAG: allophycocyanin [Cyanobacteria bacterium P01_A01_bin.3]